MWSGYDLCGQNNSLANAKSITWSVIIVKFEAGRFEIWNFQKKQERKKKNEEEEEGVKFPIIKIAFNVPKRKQIYIIPHPPNQEAPLSLLSTEYRLRFCFSHFIVLSSTLFPQISSLGVALISLSHSQSYSQR